MPLKAGIIGLPNVGKSTLYNALTKNEVMTANYAFTTIEPNLGNVVVPDERLNALADKLSPDKVTPTSIEITDIAGLVKGAHQGEGLGNQFLSHIRTVDAILHVVRCFEDDQVAHVDGEIDALRDIENIETELMLADLDIIEKRLPRIEKKAKLEVDKDISREFEVLQSCANALKSGKPLRLLDMNAFEKELIQPYGFLTMKPVMYVLNVGEEDVAHPNRQRDVDAVKAFAKQHADHLITICADLEAVMSVLDEEEKALYYETLGLDQSGIDRLINAIYELLGLKTFFTIENNLLRAWTFKAGMNAKACAGIIHSDFERGFIRAEVIQYDELLYYESFAEAKKAGRVRSEGKEYLVQDGDILLMRFNV